MRQTVQIPQDERGVIRVFSLSMTPAEAKRLKGDGAAIAAALGASGPVDPAHVEVFPLTDLSGLGLPGYLTEGGAVPSEQIAPDRARLDALEGWAMVVFSLAFGRAQMSLDPIPALTLIGTYGEAPRDLTGDGPVEAQTARPEPAPPAKKQRSDAAMSGMVATLVLAVLAIFTAVLIWIAG